MKLLERIKKDSKFLLVSMLLAALVLLLLFLIFVGFSVIFFLLLIIWIIFFLLYFKLLLKFSLLLIFVVFFVLIIITIVFLAVGSGDEQTSSTTASSSKNLSTAECKPLFDQYNNKVLKISAQDLVGTIGITIDPSNCQMSGKYILTFNASLAENPIPDLVAISNYYNYVTNLHTTSQTARGPYGVGSISLAKQNPLSLPNAFSTSQQISTFYRNPTDTAPPKGSSFYWTYEKIGVFSQARYQEMLNNNVFEVVDGLPFMEKEASAGGTFSYSINTDKAEVSGNIVKTFDLTISE